VLTVITGLVFCSNRGQARFVKTYSEAAASLMSDLGLFVCLVVAQTVRLKTGRNGLTTSQGRGCHEEDSILIGLPSILISQLHLPHNPISDTQKIEGCRLFKEKVFLRPCGSKEA